MRWKTDGAVRWSAHRTREAMTDDKHHSVITNAVERIARHRVLWVLTGVLPLIVFAMGMIWLFTQQQEHAIRQIVHDAAENAAGVMERTIGGQIGLLEGVASLSALDHDDLGAFRSDVQRLWEMHPEWRTVILTDEHQPVFNLRYPPGTPFPPLRDPASLAQVWSSRKPFVGDLSHGYVAIRVPVVRDGQTRYTMVAPTDPQFFLDALGRAFNGENRGVVLVGSDARVIAASTLAPIASGDRLAVPPKQAWADIPECATMRYSQPIAIGSSGWHLYFFVPSEAVEAPFLAKRRIVYAAGCVAAVLTAMLVLMLNQAWASRQEAFRLQQEMAARDQAQQALRKNEAKYRRLFENSLVGIFRSSPAGRFTSVNPTLAEMLGYDSPESMIAEITDVERQYYERPEDRQRFRQQLHRDGIVENFELRVRRRDGSKIWISNHTRVIRDAAGAIDHYEGVVRDINDRKLAEAARRESEARYRSLVENTLEGYFVCEIPSGRFRFLNQAICDLFGYRREEGLALTVWEVIDPGDRDLLKRRIQDRLDGKADDFLTNRYSAVHRDGSPIRIEVSTSLVGYAGKPVLQGVVRDVTEKERLQRQLQQSQKMESVGRLAGGVAHDFNNMLSVIIGFAELALERVDPADPTHGDLKEILTAAERSATITRQLLGFARQQTIAPRVIDLNETVGRILKMLQRLIGEDIDLVWRPQTDVWPVRMDPVQIDQVLANLCVNARDAIADVGKITIETANRSFDAAYCAEHPGFLPGDYVMLAVSDDGCGMDRHTVENIFEPFFTTKGVGQGTGLGLATVYGIVKQNGGFINVYSEPDSGSTFKIYLLRHAREAAAESPPPAEATPIGRGETVLVVEDEPATLKLVQRMLTSLGYHVIAADRPSRAIELADAGTEEIALLITDVVMPEMNGRQLSATMQARFPHCKCLFMSGYTANVIAHRGILDEGVAFIQKPFSKQALAIAVRRQLE